MKFTFLPEPNGIWFEIQNLSNENIFLLWDGSYFVDPTGNSSKALNMDILTTENKIVSKENYESMIPKKGTFRRFTASSKDISYYQKIDRSTYNISPNFTIQNNYYEEKYIPNAYWITSSSKIEYDGSKEDFKAQNTIEMNRIEDFVKKNNNLGLGFTFRKGEKKIDYDFKIKIDKVIVYCTNNSEFGWRPNSQSNMTIDTLREFEIPFKTPGESPIQQKLTLTDGSIIIGTTILIDDLHTKITREDGTKSVILTNMIKSKVNMN